MALLIICLALGPILLILRAYTAVNALKADTRSEVHDDHVLRASLLIEVGLLVLPLVLLITAFAQISLGDRAFRLTPFLGFSSLAALASVVHGVWCLTLYRIEAVAPGEPEPDRVRVVRYSRKLTLTATVMQVVPAGAICFLCWFVYVLENWRCCGKGVTSP